MDQLELKWTTRNARKNQTQQTFMDFVVNGKALSELIGRDLISCLGWLPAPSNDEHLKRLLLLSGTDLPSGRRSLYVCPECGDPGCGVIGAVIEQIGREITWRDFVHEGGSSEIAPESLEVGPFRFDADQYRSALALTFSI